MNRLLTVEFEFRKESYYTLIYCKPRGEHNVYRITIMDGALERILYGNHFITEIDGCLQFEGCENEEQDLLKSSIASALGTYLKLPVARREKNGERLRLD